MSYLEYECSLITLSHIDEHVEIAWTHDIVGTMIEFYKNTEPEFCIILILVF